MACTGAAAFFTWPSDFGLSCLHAGRARARCKAAYRKHAQNTTGEVRGEFQRRRVCACCRSRKTHGASAAAGRFYPKRHPGLLLSLVDTTITVDSHTHNEGACGFCVSPQQAPSDFRQRRRAIAFEVRACCGSLRRSSDRRPSRVLSKKMPRWSPSSPNGKRMDVKTR